MPRNSGGVYSLPQPLFTASTVIQSSVMNSDLSDIATALTQSIATTGVSSMTGQLKLASGAIGAPGLVFANSLTAGWYNDGTVGTWSYAVANIAVVKFNIDGSTTWSQTNTYNGAVVLGSSVTFNGAVTFAAGSTINILGALTFNAATAFNGAVTFNSTSQHNQGVTFASAATFQGNMYVVRNATTTYIGFFQCRLVASGGNLVLNQYNGNLLWINGFNEIIPFSGITLNNGSTVLSTFYYIYAYMNGTTMTLEASTTAPTVDAATGFKLKTGDSTRTLVGAALTTAGNAWSDTDGFIGVLSWYNRKRKKSITRYTAARNLPGAFGEVNTEIRCTFIAWNEEVPELLAALSTTVSGNGITPVGLLGLSIDSTATPSVTTEFSMGIGGTNFSGIWTSTLQYNPSGLTEAASHFATILGSETLATMQILGGSLSAVAAPGASYLNVTIMG